MGKLVKLVNKLSFFILLLLFLNSQRLVGF